MRTDLQLAMQKIASLNLPRPKKTSGWTDEELVAEARDIVIRELMESLHSDLKTRIVSGKVWEHLAQRETSQPKLPASPIKPEPVELRVEGSPTSASNTAPISLKSLPSFARRRVDKPARRFSSEAPSQSPDVEMHDSRGGRDRERKPKRDASQKKKSRVAESESDDEQLIIKRERPAPAAHKARKPARTKLHADYTSSEDDASDAPAPAKLIESVPPAVPQTVELPPHVEPASPAATIIPIVVEPPPKKKRAPKKKTVKVDPVVPEVVLPVASPTDDDAMAVDDVGGMPTPAPTDATSSTTKLAPSNAGSDVELEDVKAKGKQPRGRKVAYDVPTTPRGDGRDYSPEPFNRGLAADEEDLFYVKLALQRLRKGADLHPTPPSSDDEGERPPPRHPTGCARTEGFYTISVAEKIANRPTSNKAKSTFESSGAASGVAVSRLARANTRGLVRGMELHKKVTATDTDVLKFNQLRTRKKQLTFSRSGIEGYGLFALECVLTSVFHAAYSHLSVQAYPCRRDGHRIRWRAHPAASRGPAREGIRAAGNRKQLPLSS